MVVGGEYRRYTYQAIYLPSGSPQTRRMVGTEQGDPFPNVPDIRSHSRCRRVSTLESTCLFHHSTYSASRHSRSMRWRRRSSTEVPQAHSISLRSAHRFKIPSPSRGKDRLPYSHPFRSSTSWLSTVHSHSPSRLGNDGSGFRTYAEGWSCRG